MDVKMSGSNVVLESPKVRITYKVPQEQLFFELKGGGGKLSDSYRPIKFGFNDCFDHLNPLLTSEESLLFSSYVIKLGGAGL